MPADGDLWQHVLAGLRPPVDDTFAKLEYEPTPRQAEFHAATEYDVLFGGSAGGGKTKALLMDCIRACRTHSAIRVGAFRRTYGELKESLLAELAQAGYAQALGAVWNGSDYELRFPNRSMIMFRYAESIQDATRRQGGQYQLLAFDERTLTPPDVIAFLESRLRSGRADIPVLGIRSSSNPGGPGHGAVKARYITATAYGQKIITDARNRTVRFIPSKLSDNPHVNAEYALDLRGLPEPLRRAFEDGDWDVFAGQMFTEWRHERHTVAPFPLPPSWLRYVGIDYGFASPYAAAWAAVDGDHRLWIYRDQSATQVIEAEQARRIKTAEADGEHVIVYAADPSMWAKKGEAKPPADVYIENGVPVTRASNDRIIGWHRLHSYLADGPACEIHRALGWVTCPMLHVFTTCHEVIRTLPDLPHATVGNPEDADTHADDHTCLVAGTRVLTRRGQVPIEDVHVDDFVMTRAGWSRVRAAGLTGINRPVMAVATSDGRTVTATPNHPVWTENRGWVRTDALRYADTILVWPEDASQAAPDEPKPSPTTASPSAATPTRPGGLTACTSLRFPTIAPAASTGITGSCGRRRTARSLKVTTSTTATTTRTTTRWITWSASPTQNTTGTTATSRALPPRWRVSKRLALPQHNGTAVLPAAPGTSSMGSGPGATGRPSSSPANGVARSSTPATARLTPVSAPTVAAPTRARRAALTMRIVSARAAAGRSGSTGTPRPAPAPASVVRRYDAGRADVYNLTVDGEPEFFADGVLVHNCDAVRYLVMAIGDAPGMVFADAPADPVQDLLQPLGQFAHRPDPDLPLWDDPLPNRGGVVTVS